MKAARKVLAAVEVLQALRGAQPDPRQRSVLEQFPGWGPAASLFDPQPTGQWAALADHLDDLAGDDIRIPARLVDTAFYTPPALITHIYDLLRSAEFAGGPVLDLGCGTGRFLQHAPADLPIAYTGVELDPFAARIAATLHPDANIITGALQSVTLPNNHFAAAIGNVPFASTKVSDAAISFYGNLHSYFLVRAVRAVRPGGYVIVATSRHMLDSEHGLPHQVLTHADLLAAIRLPSGYFDGTDVVADVLVLRVREEDDPKQGWLSTRRPNPFTLVSSTDARGRALATKVNAVWAEHPDCVAGTMRATGFAQSPLVVDTPNAAVAVADAFEAAAPMLLPYPVSAAPIGLFDDMTLVDEHGRKEGSFHLDAAGAPCRVTDGALAPITRPTKELTALIGLRDLAVELLATEADWDTPDADLEPLRDACRAAYLEYFDAYGALNRGTLLVGAEDKETGMPKLTWKRPPMGGFRADPDAAVVFAIEVYDQETGEATPAPVLHHRVNKRPIPVNTASTPGEALAISLGEGRGLDLQRVADLLALPNTAAAFAALGDLAYLDPDSRKAVSARDYLSGDVRTKLRTALAAAALDPAFERNVAALQAVQPAWLGRHEIRIELGSPFVTADDVKDFCKEVFGASGYVTVEHVAPLAAWEVKGHGISPQAKIAYSTPRKSAFELLQAGLNGAAPTVVDEVWDATAEVYRKVRNHTETEKAREALASIAERFSTWVWESPARESRIVNLYNDTLNCAILRRHDGSHLTFPKINQDKPLWYWQRDFVDHALSVPAAMAAHDPGLGKTKTAVALAITLRQFGIANKPLYVVPCHLIEQCARETMQTAPAAKILVITREDLDRYGRRMFAARCATGDWDLVIMTHEVFTSIPVPQRVEREWLEDQLSELEDYSRVKGHAAKRIAQAVRSLETKLRRLRDAVTDPGVITFDQLGFDYLAVDEADRFRRLQVTTRADGFSLGSSKRATDLMLKVSMLRRANPSRPHLALLTGTPFTNSLAEGYVWQVLADPKRLRNTGLSSFDAWAAQFIRYENIVEVAPDGGSFRSRRRPAVVQNVPELRTMLGSFMSMMTTEMTGVKVPDAERRTIVVQPTPEIEAFMAKLVERSDKLRTLRIDPSVDNMLSVCTDGRMVALDPNLVSLTGPAPKLDAVADEVARIYHETKDTAYPNGEMPGAFQLLLCDLGTPKPEDTQTYGRIKDGLVARGVPAGKVRFVHEATSSKAREALFATCRDGRTAVLIGSTAKCGVGTNIQARLCHLAHVDPTYTPRDWIQRNGRAIRPGNLHDKVTITAFAVERSFDAFMFGTAERKSRSFEQLSRADSQVREIEDIGGEQTMSFAELKAAAAGNPLLLRQHQLRNDIRRLKLQHLTVRQNVTAALDEATVADADANADEYRATMLAELCDYRSSLRPADFSHLADHIYIREIRHARAWSSGPMCVKLDRASGGKQLLTISFGYRDLWSEVLPPKIRRQGVAAVREWARGIYQEHLDCAENERDSLRARAAHRRARAAELRAAADATDLSSPPALVAAEAELVEVNRRIDEDLLTDGQGEPAAA